MDPRVTARSRRAPRANQLTQRRPGDRAPHRRPGPGPPTGVSLCRSTRRTACPVWTTGRRRMPEFDRVWIAYGKHGVTIDVPGEATTVVAPQALEAAPDPTAVLG